MQQALQGAVQDWLELTHTRIPVAPLRSALTGIGAWFAGGSSGRLVSGTNNPLNSTYKVPSWGAFGCDNTS